MYLFIVLFSALAVLGCGMSRQNQEQQQSQQQQQRQTQEQLQAQRVSHEDNRSSVPIIINCVQISTGKQIAPDSPCFLRQGVGLPLDGLLQNDKK